VLTRCSRRGFVSRRPYKQGREHGYIYKLKNKGAEWVLYKFSHKTNDDQCDRKPPKQVGNEAIPAQYVVMLNPNENNKAFTFPQIELPILTVLNLCSKAYQSQRQQLNASRELNDFLVDLALLRARRRRDFADYLWWEQERKSSGGNQKEKTTSPPRSSCRSVEFFQRAQLQGFKLGLELGIPIGETRQLLQNQNALLRTIQNKQFRSRSFNNTHITTLQTASAKTQIEKPKEAKSKPVSTPQNITVEEPREDKDDWVEMNRWWRHLPEP